MDAEAQLRAHGYRSTPQRHQILEAVRAVPHGTPERIYQHVRATSPGMTLSTVYRVLDVLEAAGLVAHSHIDSGPPCYHPTDTVPHIHLRCRECGDVTSLPLSAADEFVATVQARSGFAADMTHVGIQGLCQRCQEVQG